MYSNVKKETKIVDNTGKYMIYNNREKIFNNNINSILENNTHHKDSAKQMIITHKYGNKDYDHKHGSPKSNNNNDDIRRSIKLSQSSSKKIHPNKDSKQNNMNDIKISNLVFVNYNIPHLPTSTKSTKTPKNHFFSTLSNVLHSTNGHTNPLNRKVSSKKEISNDKRIKIKKKDNNKISSNNEVKKKKSKSQNKMRGAARINNNEKSLEKNMINPININNNILPQKMISYRKSMQTPTHKSSFEGLLQKIKSISKKYNK